MFFLVIAPLAGVPVCDNGAGMLQLPWDSAFLLWGKRLKAHFLSELESLGYT